MATLLIIGAVISILLGVLLTVASIVLHVDEDPRIGEIAALLPQANCGACGNPGCRAMAESLVKEESKLSQCKPSSVDMRNEIAEYMRNTPNEDGEYIKVKM